MLFGDPVWAVVIWAGVVVLQQFLPWFLVPIIFTGSLLGMVDGPHGGPSPDPMTRC